MDNNSEEKKQRLIKCVVIKDKMEKSRVAKIERLVKHPLVGKYMRKTTKVMFHDENNQTKIGDEVLICETKPYSARKSYVLNSVTKESQK